MDHLLGNARDRQPRGIAGEDRLARRQPLELTEKLLLQIELLGDRFKKKCRLTNRRGQIRRSLNPAPPSLGRSGGGEALIAQLLEAALDRRQPARQTVRGTP